MRHLHARAVLCAAGLLLSVPPASAADHARADVILEQLRDPDGPVLIVAHRGCHEHQPENSLAAFRACIRLSIDIIETDVQHTRDGVLVIMHDQTVDRTTNGHGRVDDLTWAQLRKLRLRAGSGGPDAPVTRERIPSFEEALAVMNGRILVDLDAKGRNLQRVWADALQMLDRRGMLNQITVKMTAGRDDALVPQVPLLARVNYLQRVESGDTRLSDVVRTHAHLRPVAYPVIFSDLAYLKEGADAVKASGARLWVEPYYDRSVAGLGDRAAASDAEGAWGVLLNAGASVLLTDEPGRLKAYLDKRPPPY